MIIVIFRKYVDVFTYLFSYSKLNFNSVCGHERIVEWGSERNEEKVKERIDGSGKIGPDVRRIVLMLNPGTNIAPPPPGNRYFPSPSIHWYYSSYTLFVFIFPYSSFVCFTLRTSFFYYFLIFLHFSFAFSPLFAAISRPPPFPANWWCGFGGGNRPLRWAEELLLNSALCKSCQFSCRTLCGGPTWCATWAIPTWTTGSGPPS